MRGDSEPGDNFGVGMRDALEQACSIGSMIQTGRRHCTSLLTNCALEEHRGFGVGYAQIVGCGYKEQVWGTMGPKLMTLHTDRLVSRKRRPHGGMGSHDANRGRCTSGNVGVDECGRSSPI
jgi:hypothetical protein